MDIVLSMRPLGELLSSELGGGPTDLSGKHVLGWTSKIVEFARRSNVLAQFGSLMTFQFIGEALVTATGIPFPGSLCGMLLLLFYLHARGGPSDELSSVGSKLVDNLGLLFVPAGPRSSPTAPFLRPTAWPFSLLWGISTLVAVLVCATDCHQPQVPAAARHDQRRQAAAFTRGAPLASLHTRAVRRQLPALHRRLGLAPIANPTLLQLRGSSCFSPGRGLPIKLTSRVLRFSTICLEPRLWHWPYRSIAMSGAFADGACAWLWRCSPAHLRASLWGFALRCWRMPPYRPSYRSRTEVRHDSGVDGGLATYRGRASDSLAH